METDQSDIIHMRHSDLLGSVENWLHYFSTHYFWRLLKIGLITSRLFFMPQKIAKGTLVYLYHTDKYQVL